MAVNKSKVSPRPQSERSDAMQRRLMNATLNCFAQVGYASTSISTVLKEAGVSRGALLHHYPTKRDLIAASIRFFYTERQNRFAELLLGPDHAKLCLKDRMQIFWRDINDQSAISLEIMAAMRDDRLISDILAKLNDDDYEVRAQQYESFFPEFENMEAPRELIAVLVFFLRGLSMQPVETPEYLEAVFNRFEDMLSNYLTR